jgi:Cof subfamily protein (haloacid dehalogenase superfamily)
MEPPIKLLISDVDGTLVTKDKRLTPRSVAAVRALAEAGIAFTITSSRPPFGVRALITPLRLSAPIAAFNGGLMVEPDGLSTLEAYPIPAEVARRTMAFFERTGVSIWFDTDREWLVLDPSGPYVDHEIRTIGTAPNKVASFDQPGVIDHGFKIIGVSRDFDLLARCERELQAELGATATVARSQRYYLDVTHPQANKGHAVRALAQRLGIAPSTIAVIGDGRNDISMFNVAALAIAMGNADADVKQQAQFVTMSNEDDGFAAAVERWVLPRAAMRAAPMGGGPAGESSG